MKPLFDTNILVDYLNGIQQAADEIDRYKSRFISAITFIEVLVGARNEEDERRIRAFLATFETLGFVPALIEKTILLRRQFGLKIPDAIIYATSKLNGTVLVTRNTKDFKEDWPDIRIPYRLP